ncbi:cell division cycle-related protein [Marasmius crinis-equi]|uniref:Cell division cycle-related protein n=1 Tax=Marasmius crinis-equi TaxID=585013 RepID=A0ABR3EXC2_9AGAR
MNLPSTSQSSSLTSPSSSQGNLSTPQSPPTSVTSSEAIVANGKGKMKAQTPSQRYVSLLFECGLGYPLWMPAPRRTRAGEEHVINIGDVGVIRDGFPFYTLFNITQPKDSLANRDVDELPGGIDPPCVIQPRFITVVDKLDEKGRSYIRPKESILSEDVQEDLEGSRVFNFQLSRTHGALLLLPQGSVVENLQPRNEFMSRIQRHGRQWFDWAEQQGDLGDQQALYIVTGVEKCSTWGIAAWDSAVGSENLQPLSLKLTVNGLDGRCSWAYSTSRCESQTLARPTSSVEQTVFIRGFWIDRYGGIVGGSPSPPASTDFKSDGCDDGENPRGDKHANDHLGGNGRQQDHSSSSRNSSSRSTSRGPASSFGRGHSGGQSRSDFSLDLSPQIDMWSTNLSGSGSNLVTHPCKVINDLAFQLISNIDPALLDAGFLAVSHDDDWMSIIRDADEEFPSKAEITRRVSAELKYVVQGGTYYNRYITFIWLTSGHRHYLYVKNSSIAEQHAINVIPLLVEFRETEVEPEDINQTATSACATVPEAPPLSPFVSSGHWSEETSFDAFSTDPSSTHSPEPLQIPQFYFSSTDTFWQQKSQSLLTFSTRESRTESLNFTCPSPTSTGVTTPNTSPTPSIFNEQSSHEQKAQRPSDGLRSSLPAEILQVQQESESDEDSYSPPLFCRALYDYVAQHPSALTFRAGEVIKILSQQPLGWWDGLLGGERGWFPSSYVLILSEEEAEMHISGAESTAESRAPNNDTSERAPTPVAKPEELELTPAERIAQLLQQALAPPPPDLITDTYASAQASIHAVVDDIQSTATNRTADDDRRLDNLIRSVVLAVRNLHYVAAIPTSWIPFNVLPHGAHDPKLPSSNSPLKPLQRKVTAIVSRLVLSARAIQYDSGSSTPDTLNRIKMDAKALERAVPTLVVEAQRVQRTQHSGPGGSVLPPTKRLKAVFDTANIGLGLPGAGTVATWKGFGWLSVDDEQKAPQTVVRLEVINEVSESCNRIYTSLDQLSECVRMPKHCEVDQIHMCARETTAVTSSFLKYVCDINVGRHVVIDSPPETSTNTLYSRTVEKALLLVRTLETSVQSVFDDCAEVLLQAQAMRGLELGQPDQERDYACAVLNVLIASIRANLAVLQQTLQAILTLGHEQRDISQEDYNDSIEKRFSRQNSIGVQFGGAVRPLSVIPKSFDEDQEDVIDLAAAFGRVPARPRLQKGSLPPLNSSSRGYDRTESVVYSEMTVSGQDANNSSDDMMDKEQSPRGEDIKAKVAKQSDRLLRLLDNDAPLPPEVKPWFLGPDSEPGELLLDVDRTVKGGTIKALVERLTSHDAADPHYSKAFLMTFKSFTTLDELFNLLVDRFRIRPPPKLTPLEHEQWVKMKQKIVQARVINTFKSMITDDDVLEKEDMYILNRIKDFVLSEDVHLAAKQLLILIERAQLSGETKKLIVNSAQAPPPILSKTNKKLKLLDIEPLELARQLTLLESFLCQKIRPLECLQRAREQKSENIGNIAFVIQTSNRIADWVQESVLSKDDPRRRAAIVKHLISVADRCRTLNNFSTMIAIISGLNTPPIRRLRRTWEHISRQYMAQFGACEVALDSNQNFDKYRSMLASVVPPCVPFIGIFLSTLQSIQDNDPDNLPGNLINFEKRQKASEVINDITRWQAHSFNFQTVPRIREYIEESLSAFNDTRASSERFWSVSLEREPRVLDPVLEDDKMA